MRLNPFVHIEGQTVRLERSNVLSSLQDCDLLLDCTDNLETKILLNDAAVHLGKTLIAASIHQYEGQLFVYRPGGPCLRCLWPEMPPPDCVDSCAEAGVLGAVPGVFGALQAMESLKHFLELEGRLDSALLLVDLLSFKTRKIPIMKTENCPACGANRTWATEEEPIEISLEEARQRKIPILDMRDTETQSASPIEEAIPCPEAYLQGHAAPHAAPAALLCDRGIRSRLLAEALRERGMPHIYSITGGAKAVQAGSDLG